MMDYHELIDALTDEDNPNVLDYINDAVETLEHLYSELRAANTRCETLSKMLTEYQDELIPGYRERAEKAEMEKNEAKADIVEFAEDVIRQFGYHGSVNGRPAYTAGGLSTLEEAFCIAEWDDPHPAPECECEEEGCHEWAICGISTQNGYKRLCIKHCLMYKDREVAIKAALKAREQDG